MVKDVQDPVISIESHTLSTLSLLRINTSRRVSQMLYQPVCEPFAGHGFIIGFPGATLGDTNGAVIEQGFIVARIRPEVVSNFCLTMLSRLMEPFQGHFGLNVYGTYKKDPGTGVITVVAEEISSCNIQPN